MKYEFHVGDYVEAKDGYSGWIFDIHNDGSIEVADRNNHLTVFLLPEELYLIKYIGQYDFTRKRVCNFTKKDEGKIELLIGKHPNDYCNSKLMWNKINELVEAVNRLEEEVNEMA